ncbi:MAG: phosphoribosylformylglycinamidine synthase subunit PurL [Chloroflexi bacterium]|nr:phosphoribosylformylglycinamidine synthase subunit PurL [Chloroflexota bacterium]
MTLSQQVLELVGLKPEEYRLACDRLARTPNQVELGMIGALWSEHCGYKSSRPLLRRLPTRAPWVLQGPGENAGAVDVGDGLAVVLKIESHNHPSAVEPFQGAATGVGGIVRDIFTMGARPVALLNSLRFGPLDKPRNRWLLGGVVAGISYYGNCLGIPDVGGEIVFAEPYSENPLVNALCVGVARHEDLVRARASGVGNALLLVGADTGRDGILGASFASAELDARSAERRPAVQVGNPYLEKLLIEACLEALRTGHLVGLQDLGAAGLTSAVAEAAARGGSGAEIDVLRVSRSEAGMTPYEDMLSESQERMLAVVRAGREAEVQAIFRNWDLHSDVIGRVTDNGRLVVREGERVVADLPVALLTEAPTYVRQGVRPAELEALQRLDKRALPHVEPTEALLRLLEAPNIASKRWVYEQYDWMNLTNTLLGPGAADAAVLRLKGTRRAIALCTDGNGRYCYLEPRRGAAIAVAEAARNVSCTGARPLALTNCLNFGNPEKAEVYYQLSEAIAGMAEACAALDIPVVSGNVSLYNETEGRPIYPTPVVGMLGLLEDATRRCGLAFARDGDIVALVGPEGRELGGSEYLATILGRVAGAPPVLDLALEARVQRVVRAAIAAGWLSAAHDCADGGLAVALAECCVAGERGADIDRLAIEGWPDGVLFGETQSRVVVAVRPGDLGALAARCEAERVPFRQLGRVGGDRLRIVPWVDVPVAKLRARYERGLARYL